MLCSWGRYIVIIVSAMFLAVGGSQITAQQLPQLTTDISNWDIDLSPINPAIDFTSDQQQPFAIEPTACDLDPAGELNAAAVDLPEAVNEYPAAERPEIEVQSSLPVDFNDPFDHFEFDSVIDGSSPVEMDFSPATSCEFESASSGHALVVGHAGHGNAVTTDRISSIEGYDAFSRKVLKRLFPPASQLLLERNDSPPEVGSATMPTANSVLSLWTELLEPEMSTVSIARIPAKNANLTKVLHDSEDQPAPAEISRFIQKDNESKKPAIDSASELTIPREPIEKTPNVSTAPFATAHAPENGSVRQITMVFQFNQYNYKNGESNDRPGSRGNSIHDQVAENAKDSIAAQNIFDAEDLTDDAYWKHYAQLAEFGIVFPLRANELEHAGDIGYQTAGLSSVPATNAAYRMVASPEAQVVWTWQDVRQIPSLFKTTYRKFADSKFFCDPQNWLLNAGHHMECMFCKSGLMKFWDRVIQAIDRAQDQIRFEEDLERQRQEAKTMRFIAERLESLSNQLEAGSRTMLYWALENEATAAAGSSFETEKR